MISPAEYARLRRLSAELEKRESSKSAEESLLEFSRRAWPIVEPKRPFVPGWHLEAVSEHLEAVASGQLRNLVINVPPRHMKSLETCVFFPAWVWIRRGDTRWIFSSYAERLSKRDSLKMRRLIESEWYRKEFRIPWVLRSDQNEKLKYENTATGVRMATSVGGASTGEGGDFVVVDDPHKITEASSEAKRESVLEWWDEEMSSRANDPKTFAKIIIMQRLHEADLSGHVLKQGGYEHLRLPAEYDGNMKVTSIGWSDPRKTIGELLWPARFGVAELAELKKRGGSMAYAGQQQQSPSPAEGNIVKDHWWRFWTKLPEVFDEVIQSWDLSFDATDNSSFVVGQVWGRLGADKYLIYQWRDRARFTAQLDAINLVTGAYPLSIAKLVEKKANGAALIDLLKTKIQGLIPVEPRGSKEARAESVAPQIEAGNVYLPDPVTNPWVGDYLLEWKNFPNGQNDDQVDATSQALTRLGKSIDYNWEPISLTQTSKWR